MRWLRKVEDFRLLPLFVVVSMAIGIGIGKAFGISKFDLTPPIDAIKAIFTGTYDFTLANILALGVVIGLFLMMYPAMTNVRLEDLGRAFKSPKQLLLVVFFNFTVWPFYMWGLAKLFLQGEPELYTGLVLYGIAPCIAMVIVFTFLARGNVALALVLVAFNSILQMLLIPPYARLLIGEVNFDVLLVAESVSLYLGLPLALGFITRRIGVARMGEARFERFRAGLNILSIIGLLFTLVVMFGLKGDAIIETPMIILRVAIPMIIFFFTVFMVVYLIGWRLGFSYEDAAACAFNSTGRDFEIAIAIAITAFSPMVALATVVGPLIEVPIMLTLVWVARRLRARLFKPTEVPVVANPDEGKSAAAQRELDTRDERG